MKKYLILAAACLLVACQESFEDRTKREAEEYTDINCPKIVDPHGIAYDSLTYDKATNELGYYYHMFGELDQEDLTEEAKEKIEQMIRRETASSVELKMYKEHRCNFHYIYRSERLKKVVLDVRIVPEDYE